MVAHTSLVARQRHIPECRSSGTSDTALARQDGQGAHTFRRWIAESPVPAATFIEVLTVTVGLPLRAPHSLEIDGHQVTFADVHVSDQAPHTPQGLVPGQ